MTPEDLAIPSLTPNEMNPMPGSPSQTQLMPPQQGMVMPKPRDQRMDFVRNMLSNFMYSFGQGMVHNTRGNKNAGIGAALMGPFELEQFRTNQKRLQQQIELQKAQEQRLGAQSQIQLIREQRLQQQDDELSKLVPVTSPDGKQTLQVQMRAMPTMVAAGWRIQSAEKIAAAGNVSRENVANIQTTAADKRLQESFDMRKKLQDFTQAFQKEQLGRTLENRTANANIMADRPQIATIFGPEGPTVNAIKPQTAYTSGGTKGIQQIAAGATTRPPDISSTDRQNITGLWSAIDSIRQALPLIEKSGYAMGPVRGRINGILAKVFGGAGLSDEEQQLVAQTNTVLLARAFAEAGKQLTEGEKNIVMGNIGLMQDKPEFARTKLEAGLRLVNNKLKGTLGTLSKERQQELEKNMPDLWKWYTGPTAADGPFVIRRRP